MTRTTAPADAPWPPGEGEGTPPGEEALVDALVRSAFVVMGVLTRVAAEFDVSLTQLRVFGILRDRSPRMAELAAFLGLDRSTMSGLVDRAERRGLITRTRGGGDGRAVHVRLTDEGATLAARAHREVVAALAPLTGQLPAAERPRLATSLERMLEAWERPPAGSSGRAGLPPAEPGSARPRA